MLSTEQTRRLMGWNWAMALFHGAFVVLTAATADLGMTLQLYVPKFATPDPSESQVWITVQNQLLVADVHVLHIAWMALAFSALSATFHLLNAGAFGLAPAWRRWYLDGIAQARCPSRWIEYSLSAPLMGVAITYLTGSTTTDLIVAVFGLISTTMFFGHLTEVVARPADELTWTASTMERLTPHFLGYVPFVVAVAILLQGFVRAAAFSPGPDPTTQEERGMPDFVYVIVISQVLLFSCFTVVQLVITLGPPRNYINGELAYMTLSLVAKGVLSLLLLANVIALDVFGASDASDASQ